MKILRNALSKIVLYVFILLSTASAQQDSSTTQWRLWYQIGLGYNNVGLSVGNMLGFQYDEHFFGGRFIGASEIVNPFAIYPFEWLQEFALLYGAWDYRFGKLRVLISCGLGQTSGTRRGEYLYTSKDFTGVTEHYRQINYSTLGIAFNIELTAASLPFFGGGLNIVGNLNEEQSFVGVLACIQLGKVK